MSGPPGSGKTMLARRLPGLLPLLSLEEALEVTEVHSAAGRPRSLSLPLAMAVLALAMSCGGDPAPPQGAAATAAQGAFVTVPSEM